MQPNEKIELDFADVKVITPSWADEFITGIEDTFSNSIEYLNTSNVSVEASLNTVLKGVLRKINIVFF